ncbi:MAG TPA: glycosyltransferase 87 family protein [Terriglobales bacterium]|nr:glycosyltransferase 87 family protein [Terriglobales bacterium]
MNHPSTTTDSAEVPEKNDLGLPPKLGLLNHRRLPTAEWIVLALLLAAFVGGSFVPGWQNLNSEFPNYYLAAALFHRRIPLDRIYEWTWFQRQNDHLGARVGLVSFAPNPPTFILSMLPFTNLQPLAAKRAWLVLNLGFLALALWLLHRVTSLSSRRLGLLSLLCVVPLHIDFLFGRHYVLILLLLCGAYYASCLGHQRTSGVMLAAAAALKLFPALFLILFIWKRNWRAVAGFALGAIAFAAVSLFLFGIEVHRVFLYEVLSQASRGDWLGPYVLSQNSFITLWSHLFLIEPELNPFPLINSPTLYALAQASTVTLLIFSFLLSARGNEGRRGAAVQWATLIPLLLLLSTTTGADYPCLLIFTVIVGIDALVAAGNPSKALILLLLYVAACAPVPQRISNWFPLSRLVATTGIYLLLLSAAGVSRRIHFGRRWLAAGVMSMMVLTFYNLHAVRNRAEDFNRRLPSPPNGYRAANPVMTSGGVVFTEMQQKNYDAVRFADGAFRDIPVSGNVLAVAGAATSSALYLELTQRQSIIVRLPMDRPGSAPETLTGGQEPALSPNAKWLAFIREEQGRNAVWLSAIDSKDGPQMVLPSTYNPIDVSVTSEGDVIAAVGDVSDPHLFLVRHETQALTAQPALPHPARYPSISPDGQQLAFSRRDQGSWHLVVHELATGYEQQLTHASCNAISPSWENARTLLYATDCGRGVGLSAIARVVLPR